MQLSVYKMEFSNIPQIVPMRKNYYFHLFLSLEDDVAALIQSIDSTDPWIDEENVRNRIIKTSLIMQWSFDTIKENAGKYKGKLGYFEELQNHNSKTHMVIDHELENFLKEELRINI
jgi:hypothetical protein